MINGVNVIGFCGWQQERIISWLGITYCYSYKSRALSLTACVVWAVLNGIIFCLWWFVGILICSTIFLGLHSQVGTFVPLSLSMSVLLVSFRQCVPNSATLLTAFLSVVSPLGTALSLPDWISPILLTHTRPSWRVGNYKHPDGPRSIPGFSLSFFLKG